MSGLALSYPKAFYSPQEVAELVGLHAAVIRRAIDRSELRASKLCGKWRIRREDFEAWISENAN
jgi:excisionase family DNA binding protein